MTDRGLLSEATPTQGSYDFLTEERSPTWSERQQEINERENRPSVPIPTRPTQAWAEVALSRNPYRAYNEPRQPGTGHGAGSENIVVGRSRQLQEDLLAASNKWYDRQIAAYIDSLGPSMSMDEMQSVPGGGMITDTADLRTRLVEQRGNFAVGERNIPAGANERAIYQRDPARALDGVAARDLLAVVRTMNTDQLTRLQLRMDEAGVYGENGRPILGTFTTNDRLAIEGLFREALFRGSSSFSELLDEMEFENSANMQPFSDEILGVDRGVSADDISIESLTSSATLESMVDTVAQQLMGMNVDPAVRSRIVSEMQAKERAQKLTAARLSKRFSEEGSAVAELDAFMAAISGQESGGDYGAVNADSGAHGKYQIMPTNWSRWTVMAGLPSNAPRTPENQDRVARAVMASYYGRYGNWRDVAIAWYAGEGVLQNPQTLATKANASQGKYPTIRAYADKVMERFNANLNQDMRSTEALIDPETGVMFEEAFDPGSEVERAIRASQGAAIQEFAFAKNMSEFFSLLGGLPGVG